MEGLGTDPKLASKTLKPQINETKAGRCGLKQGQVESID